MINILLGLQSYKKKQCCLNTDKNAYSCVFIKFDIALVNKTAQTENGFAAFLKLPFKNYL